MTQPTVAITRAEIEVWQRNASKMVPAWRLDIDGVFIQHHPRRPALTRISESLIARGPGGLDWYRAR